MTKGGPILREFWRFAADFQSFYAWISKAAVTAPILDILLNFGPPWPSRMGVSILVCIANLVVLMFSFEFFRLGTAGANAARRALWLGVVAVSVAFVTYAFMFSCFVMPIEKDGAPDYWHRVVIGAWYRGEINELRSEDPLTYTPGELLKRFENKPERIWVGVGVIRVLVLVFWMIFWICLSVLMAAFVSLRWRGADATIRKKR